MTVASNRFLSFTRRVGAAMTAAILVSASLLLPTHSAADDKDKGQCSNSTLNGEYASYISGVRGNFVNGNFVVEKFVGISLRKYDGDGNFVEEFASFHAESGLQGGEAPPPGTYSGTYHVNPDCTGTSTLFPPAPGAPKIVSDFVIMDEAKEVREIVTYPLANIVTAVFKRK